MNKNIFLQLSCSFLVLQREPDLGALLGGPLGLQWGHSGFPVSLLHWARDTQKKPLRADKSHIPAWPSCTPRQNKHAFLQKPCCSHCWGGGGCAGLLTLSHMQILQLKSKSPLENPNQRDATQSLCPVQVFVIRTTRSFYNHNMQCNAVGFY